jgi:phospholipase/carboxylesterase
MDKVILEPTRPARSCIIWLHGLGADGHDFTPIVKDLNISNKVAARFIFPHADIRPITINNGAMMRGWYDIKEMGNINDSIDIEGIQTSINAISNIIDQQILLGIPSENIILVGFSQGGVVAINTLLQYPHKLSSGIALSCYMPAWQHFKLLSHTENTNTPIMQAHGSFDPIVPFFAGQELKNNLEENGNTVKFHNFPMGHTVCPDEIILIGEFITNSLLVNL